MSTVSSVSSSSSTSSTNGFSAMGSDEFIKVMLAQLQQQDPLNPSDSDQLLTQMSQIKQLESNTQLMNTLTDTSLKQSIGSAGNLIGSYCVGLDESGSSVEGIVTSVAIQNKNVYLELNDGSTLPLNNVMNIYGVVYDGDSSSSTSSTTTDTSTSASDTAA